VLLSQPQRLSSERLVIACERSTIKQLHNAAQYTTMSNSQIDVAQHHRVTPPPVCTHQLLTPPSTNKKSTAGPLRVIALFRQIQAGTHTNCGPWIEFQLAQGDFDRIQDTLRQDKVLWGFVDDKIRSVNPAVREIVANSKFWQV